MMNDEIQWGLKAVGTAGDTQVDLDESCSGDVVYELEIARPEWSFRCRIGTTDAVCQLLRFLTSSDGSRFTLCATAGVTVQVLRDDEFSDRFFVLCEYEVGQSRFAVAGPEQLNELTNALEQVVEELH